MIEAPDFAGLTPPPELVTEWEIKYYGISKPFRENRMLQDAVQWGAQHGWNEARQLWPTPITDRPPTEADGDEFGDVQVLSRHDQWVRRHWSNTAGRGWLHTPNWRALAPKPTLKDQALAKLKPVGEGYVQMLGKQDIDLIRRALEGGEGEE